MLETRPFLEVTDGEFDDGVSTMFDVEEGGVAVTIGDEGVVALVGEQRRSRLVKLGATNDETLSLVVSLSDPGFTVHGVINRRPTRFSDQFDGPCDRWCLRHGDRVAQVVVTTGLDDVF